MKTKQAFCAIEQLDREHTVIIDKNGEYLFTCECGSFFKFPAHFGKDEIADGLIKLKTNNEGQVTAEEIEEANQEKLKNI